MLNFVFVSYSSVSKFNFRLRFGSLEGLGRGFVSSDVFSRNCIKKIN